MSAPMLMGPGGQPMGPVMVLNQQTRRQTGRPAQLANIQAARAVAGIVRTTLGPRSRLKMLLDPMGTVVLTNDGHCILREVDVSHPTARSVIELARAVDEEVGDGTTSVVVVTAEVLQQAEPFLRSDVHPLVLVQAYNRALACAVDLLQKAAVTVDVEKDTDLVRQLVTSAVGTKFSSRWNELMVDMAVKAVRTVAQLDGGKSAESAATSVIDLKRYAKVEKIPGGEISESQVLTGVMFQKDVVHSSMRRRIEKPRILLLDCPLEYKRGESAATMELTADKAEQDWNALLKLEEDYVRQQCQDIIAHKPDIVITEKGVSDLAQHYLARAGVTAFRRLRKADNNRVAAAVGATVASLTEEIQDSDVGTGCGLFEMRMLGSEWFCYLTECARPAACSIVLRGGSKDVLAEMERNLHDAMLQVRNVVQRPALVPGGGAIEMALSVGLRRHGQMNVRGIQQAPFIAVGEALEAIPRILAQNCGVSVIRTITQLRAKHAAAYEGEEAGDGVPQCSWGINGETGELADMKEYGVWEPLTVKLQVIKTALESACMILRIDDIVSGSKKRQG